MQHRFRNRPLPAGNPLANVFVVVVGLLTIAVSVVVGFFAFVALAGFMLVFATVIGLRAWWLGRKIGTAEMDKNQPGNSASGPNSVIEGEFRVVRRVDTDD